MALNPGHTLLTGRYRIVRPLGRGGFGFVYEAEDTLLGDQVAIKELIPALVAHEVALNRFLVEAKATMRLAHKRIVRTHNVFGEGGNYYIVMEYMPGGSLEVRLQQGGPLPPDEAVRIAAQVCDGLECAHQEGIVHCDLKPANILFAADGGAKVADFGIAHVSEQMLNRTWLTPAGSMTGTLPYMSPEQADGVRDDTRVDIYALGAVLYRMLTGRTYLDFDQRETPGATADNVHRLRSQQPTPPSAHNRRIPAWLDTVVLRALAKRPEERYVSADALRAVLLQGEAVPDLPTPLPAGLEPQAQVVDQEKPVPASDGRLATASQYEPGQYARVRDDLPSPIPFPLPALELEVSSPPPPEYPPMVPGFIGRRKELAHFAETLKQSNLAVITGMAGVGKTALAAELAYQVADPARTFWHAFHRGEGVDAIVWRLAGFLARHGQAEVWNMLEASRQGGGQPPPHELVLDSLLSAIPGRGYLLCLDDCQYILDDPLLEQIVDRLRVPIQAGVVSLIVVSRAQVPFLELAELEELAGLSLDDTGFLLADRELALSEEQLGELYRRTGGNAQLLLMAVAVLGHAADPDRVISQLPQEDQIATYLLKEIDDQLTPEEQAVMGALAALLGYPATADAIEAVAGRGGLRRALIGLRSRRLVAMSRGDGSQQYRQHDMVRDFYYDLLSRDERRTMHRRAGEYYETEEPDVLRAALQFEQAGEYERAARLATGDVWAIINQGQARALRQLLAQFTAQQMPPEQWIAVSIARGDAHAFLGEGDPARSSYQEAFSRLEALPDLPETRRLRARACYGLGTLLEGESPDEALDWLRKGQDELSGAGALEQALLHLRAGSVLIGKGDPDAASAELETSLKLLPDGTSSWRASALGNLGTIYHEQGDLEQARDCYVQALQIYQKLHNTWGIAGIRHNLAVLMEMAGRWEEAAAEYEQALRQAEQLGSIVRQVDMKLALGVLLTNRGEIQAAMGHLLEALDLARQHDLVEEQIHIQSWLGEVHVRLGEWTAAADWLTRAEALSQESGVESQLPEIYCGWAQVCMARGERHEALQRARQAADLAHGRELDREEGVSQRVLGQALAADGRWEEAMSAFERSVSILAELEPYEAARTQVRWGTALRADGDVSTGTDLLQRAQATFEQLGARRDLAEVKDLLGAGQ